MKYVVLGHHKTSIFEAMIGKISKYSCHFRILFMIFPPLLLLESYCYVTMAFTADLRDCSYKNIRSMSREKFKLDYSHCVVAKCVVGNHKLVCGHTEQPLVISLRIYLYVLNICIKYRSNWHIFKYIHISRFWIFEKNKRN